MNADSVTIRGLAIYGFGSGNIAGNIVIRDVANSLIEGNVLGAAATAFVSTGALFGNNVTGSTDPRARLRYDGPKQPDRLFGRHGHSRPRARLPHRGQRDPAQRGRPGRGRDRGPHAPYTVQRNLIVESSGIGIDAGGPGAVPITENTIQGNGFGSATERSAIFVSSDTGATVSLNVITGNAAAGVVPARPGVRITKNSIRDNGTIGIDLPPPPIRNGDGVNPNDVGDVDGGPNGLQNFPLITLVEHPGGGTRIVGNFHGAASTTFDLEFFENGSCLDFPRDFLEGETYVGSTEVTTDASGNAGFDVTFPVLTQAGARISATATDPAGNTSEFSQRIIFSISPASGPAAGGTPITIAGTNFVDPTTITFGGTAGT